MKLSRRFAVAAVGLSLGLGLAGCSEPVTAGVVVDKRFVPEHETNGQCLVTTDFGSGVKVCTLYDRITVADRWTVTVQAPAEEAGKKPRSSEISVKESVFDAVEVGEQFDVEGCLNVSGPENC